MAFENNSIPFQISFYPTSFGANTLLNGGIQNFKYYTLCDKWAYYPATVSNYVPSVAGSTFVGAFQQSAIPNSLFNGSINQVPVSNGLAVKDNLILVNNGALNTQKLTSGIINYTFPVLDYQVIKTTGGTNSFLGVLNGFGIPLTPSSLNKWNSTPENGGYKNSAVEGMSASTYLMISFNRDYCSIANGNTVKIEIPIDLASTGDTLVQMYGTQVDTGQNLSYFHILFY